MARKAEVANTELKIIKINSFRGLKNINIEFGKRISVICGKNGTSKSTILGVVAQMFSFRKDYTKIPNVDLHSKYRTLSGDNFESVFSDHFRFSPAHDHSGSMDVDIEIFDAAENKDLSLKLALYKSKDRVNPRPIVRGNTETNGASSSRNVTHPVIYLSLKRLMPIADRLEYKQHDIDFLTKNLTEFKGMSNQLLNRANRGEVTATRGTINSVVVHGSTYDQDSVSAGEDNVGQILQAIFSFRKLKSEYSQYRGGILLIDEADAGLFPAAQTAFIEMLARECKNLNLQVIMTSHSPTMIEKIHSLSEKDPSLYKTLYLTDTYGEITLCENYSWPDIFADLHVQTIAIDDEVSFPKINVYFEDREGVDFYDALITNRKLKKIVNCLRDVTLGCKNYVQLVQKKIPEFSKKSLIILDADVEGVEDYSNIVLLPGVLPPDQLLYEFLFNLPANHSFWKNDKKFTKPVFSRISADLTNRLEIELADGESLDLLPIIIELRKTPNEDGAIRTKFKDFYKTKEIQAMIKGSVKNNPFRLWIAMNEEIANEFQTLYISAIKNVAIFGHGIESALIHSYIES
jgi:AAA15 family ATPase/GTPase